MRIATSLISVDQAKKNLALEIRPTDTFDAVRARRPAARGTSSSAWSPSRAPTDDQLATLYSNLYRLFLYPNSAFENTGTAARTEVPVRAARSPTRSPRARRRRPARRSSTARCTSTTASGTPTGPPGPRYSLFTPDNAGEMIDGFVQQYRDGGWISRWSSPGYAEPDDRHQLGRRVRRRVPQGRQRLRRPGRLRRRGEERDRRAAGRTPTTRVGRKGLQPVDLPRLHARRPRRGLLVGARGLRQRLRHRQHGQGAAGQARAPGDPRRATGRSPRTSSAAPRTT